MHGGRLDTSRVLGEIFQMSYMPSQIRVSLIYLVGLFWVPESFSGDYSGLILRKIAEMPRTGGYASYRKDLPEGQRLRDLEQTVGDLGAALKVGPGGKLKVNPSAADKLSFCSSATYLLFCEVVAELQREGIVSSDRQLSRELADVGEREKVIAGKMDGVGIFGHWNADGPGTAMLFHRLGLGRNFYGLEHARPGDFLKIFWNENIGKGERGHLVVFLGMNAAGNAVQVWSSNLKNSDGSSGYGTMWVEKERIKRAVLSRLEHPENLLHWLKFSNPEKTSDYLVRIRQTGSTGEEMKRAVGAIEFP